MKYLLLHISAGSRPSNTIAFFFLFKGKSIVIEHERSPMSAATWASFTGTSQQDSAKPHAVLHTSLWLWSEGIWVFDWPVCSWGLFPIREYYICFIGLRSGDCRGLLGSLNSLSRWRHQSGHCGCKGMYVVGSNTRERPCGLNSVQLILG